MTMSKAEKRRFDRDLTEGPDHSPLFWWMVKHADEMTRQRGTKRMDWSRHCVRFAKLGITDARGHQPTVATARKTWWRVRQYLATRPAASREKVRTPSPPSRQRTDWQPPLARAAQPSTPRTSPPPAIYPIPPREGDKHLPAEVRAKLAAIDSQFEYLDRHIIRPTKRG
jgi:hypothetical protein